MSGGKKFLTLVFSSIFILFVIWGIVFMVDHMEIYRMPINAQITYLRRYHLDLKATIGHFQQAFSGNIGRDLMNTLGSFRTTLQKFNNNQFNTVTTIISAFNNGHYPSFSGGFNSILAGLNALINPLYGIVQSTMVIAYLAIILVQLFGVIFNVVWGFYEFIFNPIFIEIPITETITSLIL